MQYIHDTKNGGLIYSVDDDGRGRGTLTKLKVYHYRDRFGGSSDDACRALGLKYDERDYYAVSRILLDLGLERIILLSENGNKKQALEENGVTVIDAKGIFGG
jgi:3,4-dihydroxy 2-butanone 4-phosphate synthase/GTP cyclohydrolase II